MSGVIPAPTDPNRRPRPPRRIRRRRGHWIRFCLSAAPSAPADAEERHDGLATLQLMDNPDWRATLRRIAERGDER